jgi:hypothetical protein
VVELDSDHQADSNIVAAPAEAAHSEFKADVEIRQTHRMFATCSLLVFL